MHKQKILIIGSGFIAKDIADLIDDIPEYEVAGFVIDKPPYEKGLNLLGKPIIWIDELENFNDSYKAVLGIARMQKISFIEHVRSFGVEFISLVHPSARVSKSTIMGEGIVINGGVQVAVSSQLGDFVYANRGVLIGHDTVIGDYSVIAPGANIAGNVKIGNATYIGLGANILERVSIGDKCFIGAGSLVTTDVPDQVKVVGIPARIIEKNIKDF